MTIANLSFRRELPQISNLTGLRGYAALWVVIFHYRVTANLEVFDFGEVVAKGYRGVDIFFVLSGFVISYANRDLLNSSCLSTAAYGNFMARRFARIYPLHLATFLVLVLMIGLANLFQIRPAHGDFSMSNAWLNLLLLHAWGFADTLSWNDPSWSVSAEWFAYIVVFVVCARWLVQCHRYKLLASIAALWLLIYAYAYSLHQSIGLTYDLGILRIVPEFLAGFWLYRQVSEAPRDLCGDTCTAAALLGIIILCFIPAPLEVLLLPLIMILIFGLYRGGSLTNALFQNRLVLWLGEISYSIYLVHLLTLIVANVIIRHLLGTEANALTACLTLLAEFAALLLVAHCAYRWIELPGRKFVLSRFVVKRSSRRPAS